MSICIKQAARLFIAGKDLSEALKTIAGLERKGAGYVLDFVAEQAHDKAMAKTNIARYLDAIKRLPNTLEKVVSIKLTGIVANFTPDKKEEAIEAVTTLLTEIHKIGGLLVIDMEEYEFKEATLDILKEAIRRSGYKYASNLGIVNQTYLKDSLEVTRQLTAFAKECRQATGGTSQLFIRFVKGAYPKKDKPWILETHAEVDQRYIDCLRIAFEEFDSFRIAIASHNGATIAGSIALAKAMGKDHTKLEFEMLLGMTATPLLYALIKKGYVSRFYLPVGSFEESLGYFLRRMDENANSSSCQRTFKQYYDGDLTADRYSVEAFRPPIAEAA